MVERTGEPDSIVGSQARQLILMDALRRAERQLSASRVAAVITHYVGTPLNVIAGRAGLIKRHPEATQSIVSDADCIQQKVEQVASKLRTLVDMLSIQEANDCVISADQLLVDAIELYEPIAAARSCKLSMISSMVEQRSVVRYPLLVVLTSLLSLAVNDAQVGSVIEVSALNLRSDEGLQPSTRFAISAPGCIFIEPRSFELLGISDTNNAKGANSDHVLGICSAIAKHANATLQVKASSAGDPSILELIWPSAMP